MRRDTQYGHPQYFRDFGPDTSATSMIPVDLNNAPAGTLYNEAWLQQLIMSHPSILPIDQIEPAFVDLVPICAELRTRSDRWIDNLFVTPQGNIILAECKLWRNPEARRKVIAQIIDYAKDLAEWTYQELENAIRNTAAFVHPGGETPPHSLYEKVATRAEIDEARFIDAVTRNLKRGRFLLLIVGDGIREDIESLTEFLQQYAGLHFTLALIELALYEVPDGGGYVAQPRVLAKTINIPRGIVIIRDGTVTIKPPETAAALGPGSEPRKTNITKELLLERLKADLPSDVSQRLTEFTDTLAQHMVLPEFGTASLILRWYGPDGTKAWNLGNIYSGAGSTDWRVYLDYMGGQVKNSGLIEPYKRFLSQLALLVPGAKVIVRKDAAGYVADPDGKSIRLASLLADDDRAQGWIRAIAEFQAAVKSSLGTE